MRKYVAEFVATFFLVFVGAGSMIADSYLSQFRVTEAFGFLGVALAHGLALAVAIAAVAHISGGHVNPAVSIAYWIARRISLQDLLGYVVSQLAGAVAAAFLLRGFFSGDILEFTGLGIPARAEGIGVIQAVGIEAILTFFLVFAIWGTAVDKRGLKTLAPFAIGLTVTFDFLAGGAFTGAAMNPARWFGPAIATTDFKDAVVWLAGPILGALLASVLYETFLLDQGEPDDEFELAEEEEVKVPAPAPPKAAARQEEPRYEPPPPASIPPSRPPEPLVSPPAPPPPPPSSPPPPPPPSSPPPLPPPPSSPPPSE